MDMKAALKISRQCKKKADLNSQQGNYCRAFANYLLALKLNPSWKIELKETFDNTLQKLELELEDAQRYTDLFKCYEQALEVFPENAEVYFNFGSFLFRSGSAREAFEYFRKCCELNPNHVDAATSLESTKNLLIERWHFRMLNCRSRNTKFANAIKETIDNYNCRSVLDIGSGTGILSLYCADSGAEKIYACEMSMQMAQIASEVFSSNNKPIKLSTKHSSDLTIPEDLDEPVDLIVCEIFDSALLGEHVLPTLIHAWEKLLKPSGKVIPHSGRIYLRGIENNRFVRYLSLANELPEFALHKYNLGVKSDCYDTEVLDKKYLTEELSILSVNFNNQEEMKRILAREKDTILKFLCLESGDLHYFICRFDLHLDDNIVIHSGPNYSSCWDEAVFPVVPYRKVTKGDVLSVKVSFENSQVSCSVVDPPVEPTTIVSDAVMTFLNDSDCVVAHLKTFQLLKKENARILDLSIFPIIGLKAVLANCTNQLTCVWTHLCDKEFFNLFIEDHGLSDQVQCLNVDDVLSLCESQQVLYDVIVLPIVGSSGVIKQDYLSGLEQIRSCLKPGGRLIPESCTIYGLIVDSYELIKMSRVISENVPYNIADVINVFKSNQHIDFKMSKIDMVKRSHVLDLITLNLSEISDGVVENQVVIDASSGPKSAIIYWFEIQMMQNIAYSNFSDDSPMNHAAFIFDYSEFEIAKNIYIFYRSGNLLIKLSDN